jgi:hypothetical protein
MSFDIDYWQKEAHRYDLASRSSMSRVRTEITLGITVLSSIVALVVVNKAFPLLIGVPILATAVWGLALWSAQESFLLDAHLMFAERMMNLHLESEGKGTFPTWADNGGNITRLGYTQKLLFGAWIVASLAATGSCIYFVVDASGVGPLAIILMVEVVLFVIAAGLGGWAMSRAGAKLFARLEERFRLEDQKFSSPKSAGRRVFSWTRASHR